MGVLIAALLRTCCCNPAVRGLSMGLFCWCLRLVRGRRFCYHSISHDDARQAANTQHKTLFIQLPADLQAQEMCNAAFA
jgi:hypothetical protein